MVTALDAMVTTLILHDLPWLANLTASLLPRKLPSDSQQWLHLLQKLIQLLVVWYLRIWQTKVLSCFVTRREGLLRFHDHHTCRFSVLSLELSPGCLFLLWHSTCRSSVNMRPVLVTHSEDWQCTLLRSMVNSTWVMRSETEWLGVTMLTKLLYGPQLSERNYQSKNSRQVPSFLQNEVPPISKINNYLSGL